MCGGVELTIEAVSENLDLKRAVFFGPGASYAATNYSVFL